ncbi:hypothetical protein KW794_03625 [Candidatus Saccharibacteria bacterium]|nr:hypothetical protein [Candidatus Saccharibacteria bacterium]
MSRRIANLIAESEQLVTKLINELESKNGYPSHDVRHLAKNIQTARTKIADLGLDSDDTTAEELYHALLVKFEADSRAFAEYFDAENLGFDARAVKATQLATKYLNLPSQWVLKTAAAKQALRTNPPKRVMRYLNYRSPESMLKRENLWEIFVAAQVLESKVWHKNLAKQVAKHGHSDLEMRPLKLMSMNSLKWSIFEDQDDCIVFDASIGAVVILPKLALHEASLLTLVLLQMVEYTPKPHLKPGDQLSKMADMLEWWAGTDHLIADLSQQHVSLNVKDCAINAWLKNDFQNRALEQGRRNFWHTMVEGYKNRPEAEALFDDSVKAKIADLKLNVPEPALEFAEEFDG